MDRLVPFKDNEFLTTSYHAVKNEKGEIIDKVGDLCIVEVAQDKTKLMQKARHQLDYGVLSVKREDGNMFSVGASDGTVKML